MAPETLAALVLALVAAGALILRRSVEERGQGSALPWLSLANITEEAGQVLGGPYTGPNAEGNVRAFLAMIRAAEGTAAYPDPYRVAFGGTTFESLADHPRLAFQFRDLSGRTLWTTAAGAYQFLAVSPLPDGSGRWTKVDTWDRLRRKLDLPDFSPASQDAAAVALIDEAGALRDVEAGRFDVALDKVRRVWASLPGAGYDQPERSIAWARAQYINAGGHYA